MTGTKRREKATTMARKTEDYAFDVTVIAPASGGDVEAVVGVWLPRQRDAADAIAKALEEAVDVIAGSRVAYHADGLPKIVRTDG